MLVLASLQLSACGYLLHPERNGQTSGRLDAAVVVLDAIGLFFYVVPGVVAFAVDISTGAIYLAPGEESVLEKHGKPTGYIEATPSSLENKLSEDQMDVLAESVSKATGLTIHADQIIPHQVDSRLPIVLSEIRRTHASL